MTIEELSEKLSLELQERINGIEDTDWNYECALANVAGGELFNADVAINLVKDAAIKQGEELKIAYAAFYCLNSFYRFNYDSAGLESIWNKASSFPEEKFKSIKHLEVLRFLLNINLHNNEEEEEYLQKAYDNCKKFNKNPGYLQAFADMYITIMEKNEWNSKYCEKLKKKWNKSAFMAMITVMNDYESAKFYCTYGRLLSLNGDYKEADKQISIAISKEIVNRRDRVLRLQYYQSHKILNLSKQRVNKFDKEIAEEKRAIKDLKGSVVTNIEMIGLFSGIIALVLGSLTIANGQTAVQAGLLIFTLMGCLSAALAAFSLLLHLTDENYKKPIAGIIIAASIIISITATFLSWHLEKNPYIEHTENSPNNGISYSGENMEEDNV